MVTAAASSSRPSSRSSKPTSTRSAKSSATKSKPTSTSKTASQTAKKKQPETNRPAVDQTVRSEKRQQAVAAEADKREHFLRNASSEPARPQLSANTSQGGESKSLSGVEQNAARKSAQTAPIPKKTSLPQNLEKSINTIKGGTGSPTEMLNAKDNVRSALREDSSNPESVKQSRDVADRVAHEMMQDGANPEFEKLFDRSVKHGTNQRVQDLAKSLPASPATQAKISKELETLKSGNSTDRPRAQDRLNRIIDKTRPANGQAVFDKAEKIVSEPREHSKTGKSKSVESFLETAATKNPGARKALDQGKIAAATSDLSHYNKDRRSSAKEHLDNTFESGSRENKKFATHKLAETANQDDKKYQTREYIKNSNAPESYDAAAQLVANNKNEVFMEEKLAKGGKTALAAIEHNWDAIQQNDPTSVRGALQTPEAAQALKDGDPPGLERVFRDSLAAEPKLNSWDSRLKALGSTDTPAARDALVDLAKRSDGAGAGSQLAQTASGRDAALTAFENGNDTTKRNLAEAALHPDQANQGKAKEQLLKSLDAKDSGLQEKAFEQAGQFVEANSDDAAFQKQLFESGARGVTSENGKTQAAANNLLEKTLSTGQIDSETRSKAFTQIGQSVQDGNTGQSDYWARNARDTIEKSSGAHGAANMHKAILSNDPNKIATSLEAVNGKGMELVQAQLGQEKPPRSFETVLDGMKSSDKAAYEKSLDTMNRSAEPADSTKKIELQKQLAKASKDSSDSTLEDFSKRNIRDDSWQSANAAKALGNLGTKRAAQALVDANQDGRGSVRDNNDALANILDNKGNPDTAKDIAARHLSTTSPNKVSKNAMESLVTHAAKSDNAELKSSVLSQLPKGPLTDEKLGRVSGAVQARLQKAIDDAPKGSDMKALGELYKAQAMAKQDDLKGKVDSKKIDATISELQNKEPLKSQLQDIKKSAVKDVFGSRNPAQLQEEYLKSDSFQQRLRLLGDTDQKSVAKQELGRLAMIDPARAEKTSDALVRKSLQQNGVEMFQKLDPKTQVDGLAKVISDASGRVGNAGSIAQSYSGYLNAVDAKASVVNQNNQVNKMLDADIANAQRLGDTSKLSTLKGVKSTIQNLQKTGVLGSVGALATITSMASGGVNLRSADGIGRAAQNTFGLVDSANDVAKLTGWLTKGTNSAAARKLIGGLNAVGKYGKMLGPVGNVLGAALDIYGAIGDYKAGDMHGFSAKIASGAAGVTAAATGGLIALGVASGPVGWTVMAGAGVVGAGAWVWDNTFGESNEESFMRRGVVIGGEEQNFWIG
jgi:hypothetical protein